MDKVINMTISGPAVRKVRMVPCSRVRRNRANIAKRVLEKIRVPFKIGLNKRVPDIHMKRGIVVRGNSREVVIKDTVILRRDSSSIRVENQRHSSRVEPRVTKEDAQARAFLPLRQFLAIL
jgi:hypothetical protein